MKESISSPKEVASIASGGNQIERTDQTLRATRARMPVRIAAKVMSLDYSCLYMVSNNCRSIVLDLFVFRVL